MEIEEVTKKRRDREGNSRRKRGKYGLKKEKYDEEREVEKGR